VAGQWAGRGGCTAVRGTLEAAERPRRRTHRSGRGRAIGRTAVGAVGVLVEGRFEDDNGGGGGGLKRPLVAGVIGASARRRDRPQRAHRPTPWSRQLARRPRRRIRRPTSRRRPPRRKRRQRRRSTRRRRRGAPCCKRTTSRAAPASLGMLLGQFVNQTTFPLSAYCILPLSWTEVAAQIRAKTMDATLLRQHLKLYGADHGQARAGIACGPNVSDGAAKRCCVLRSTNEPVPDHLRGHVWMVWRRPIADPTEVLTLTASNGKLDGACSSLADAAWAGQADRQGHVRPHWHRGQLRGPRAGHQGVLQGFAAPPRFVPLAEAISRSGGHGANPAGPLRVGCVGPDDADKELVGDSVLKDASLIATYYARLTGRSPEALRHLAALVIPFFTFKLPRLEPASEGRSDCICLADPTAAWCGAGDRPGPICLPASTATWTALASWRRPPPTARCTRGVAREQTALTAAEHGPCSMTARG